MKGKVLSWIKGKFLLSAAALLLSVPAVSAQLWLGADISGVSADEAHGRTFYDKDGNEADLFALMKDYGMNAIRLRVWVNPKDGFCSPSDVLEMARRAQDVGLPVMIDFHYSDWWADPGKQNIPEAWKDMSVEEMSSALYDHTRETLELLRDNGIEVPWVQVGNETTHGFLWPVGRIEENPQNYAMLTQAGYDAVKEVYPDAQVIVHLDNGFDADLYDRVFDILQENGTRWDIIGMSVYPYWAMECKFRPDAESTLNDAIANAQRLYEKYGTNVMITEVGVDAREPEKGRDFMIQLFDKVIDESNGSITGVFYWAPEINADADYHLGAFDKDRPTVILDAFRIASEKAGN